MLDNDCLLGTVEVFVNRKSGPGDGAQELNTIMAFPRFNFQKTIVTSFPGSLGALSWPLWAPGTCGAQTLIQAKQPYTENKEGYQLNGTIILRRNGPIGF